MHGRLWISVEESWLNRRFIHALATQRVLTRSIPLVRGAQANRLLHGDLSRLKRAWRHHGRRLCRELPR